MLRIGTTLLLSTRFASGSFVLGPAAPSSSSTSRGLGSLVVVAAAAVGAPPPSRSSSSSSSSRSEGGSRRVEAAAGGPQQPLDAPAQKWDVNRYQASHSFVWKYGASLLELIDYDQLSNLVASGEPIRALDVGCGSGQLTKLLRDELGAKKRRGSTDVNVQVFGMDLDPDMIWAAQEQNPDIRFFVGDARNVQLPMFEPSASASHSEKVTDDDASIHLVLSNAALHWIPPTDIDRAVASISRLLVPGGQFVVEFGGRDNLKTIVKAMKRVFETPPSVATSNDESGGTCPRSPYYGDDHVDTWYYPSVADFAGRLALNHIEVTSAALFDRPTILDRGDDGMENWIRMFGSKYWRHLPNLTEAELDDKIALAVEMLRPDLYDSAARQWTADYRRIRIVGRKQQQQPQQQQQPPQQQPPPPPLE